MKTKQVWTLLVILLVLGVGTFIRQIKKPAELAVQEYSPLDLSFKEESVQKIVLERTWEAQAEIKPSQKVELVRAGTEWQVPGFFNARVNPKKIEEFFRQTREAKGEQRAKGKQFFKDFGIEDTGSFHVSFFEGDKPSLGFYLGTKEANGSFFIRKAGSDVIYLTETNFFAQMGIYADPATENLFPEQWAAKDFLKLDPAKVLSFQIKTFDKGKETIKTDLEFLNGSWKSRKNPEAAISSQKVADFLAAEWQAAKVIAAESKDFSKPFWQMNLVLDSRSKVFKAVKDEKSGEIFLSIDEEKIGYKIDQSYFGSLDKDESAFLQPPAPAPAPAPAKA